MEQNNTFEELELWFAESPAWVQVAAKKLLTGNSSLKESDIDNLAEICIKEASKEKVSLTPVSLEDLSARPAHERFSIVSIANISGVNAIKQTEPLFLPDTGLVSILGSNGSGKSGYARILKKASGNTDVKLLSNIYEDKPANPSCDISISRKDSTRTVYCDFKKYISDEDLSHIDVFDSSVANQYIGGQSSPSYLPSIFSVLISLVNACTPIKEKINQAKAAISSSCINNLPEEIEGSSAAALISSISSKSHIGDYKTEWTDEDGNALKASQYFINEKSPEAQIKLLKIRIDAMERLISALTALQTSFAKETLDAFRKKIIEREELNTNLLEASKIIAGDYSIEVGSNTWRSLWEAALSFSKQLSDIAPSLEDGISDKSICPLCLRTLDEPSERTMASLKGYAESKISLAYDAKCNEVKESQNRFNKAIAQIQITKADIELSAVNEDEARGINNLTDSFSSLNKTIQQANPKAEFSVVDASKEIEALNSLKTNLATRIESFERVLCEEEIQRHRTIIKELLGKKFLSMNRIAIEKEIERLQVLEKLDRAIKATTSNRISKKANELSEQLIAKDYISAFHEELAMVSGGKIVAGFVKQRAEKGKIPYAIRLFGHEGNQVKPDEILSEGEKRIVALAAFFAEARRTPSGCPLIFDDPICSLDEDYEQNVLERLVRESACRQVIVFTHRISVVSELEQMAKEKGGECATKQILTLSDNVHKGNPVNDYQLKKKPDKRLNCLLSETLPKLKIAEEANDVAQAQLLSENTCKNIRIALEACVEFVLLNSTVIRYRRDIQTKGKLKDLAKISKEDCDLIEKLMTKYSFSQHFAPYDETPRYFTYQILKSDCDMLSAWIKEFSARTVS